MKNLAVVARFVFKLKASALLVFAASAGPEVFALLEVVQKQILGPGFAMLKPMKKRARE